jgi:hypothetical protein
MKNHFQIFKLALALTILIGSNAISLAQPPPPSASQHGTGGNQAPSGAPIGEGMFFLIGLAGLYGGKKVYDFRKEANSI